MSSPCPRGGQPQQCERTSDSNFKRVHQGRESRGLLPRMSSQGFLPKNFQAGLPTGRDKSSSESSGQENVCVLAPGGLTKPPLPGNRRGTRTGTPLLLPSAPPGPESQARSLSPAPHLGGAFPQCHAPGGGGGGQEQRRGWGGHEPQQRSPCSAVGGPWLVLSFQSEPFTPFKTELITCSYPMYSLFFLSQRHSLSCFPN